MNIITFKFIAKTKFFFIYKEKNYIIKLINNLIYYTYWYGIKIIWLHKVKIKNQNNLHITKETPFPLRYFSSKKFRLTIYNLNNNNNLKTNK